MSQERLKKEQGAHRILNVVENELTRIGSAFMATGNTKMADALWELADQVRLANVLSQEASSEALNELVTATEGGTRNMLKTALVMRDRDRKEPKNG